VAIFAWLLVSVHPSFFFSFAYGCGIALLVLSVMATRLVVSPGCRGSSCSRFEGWYVLGCGCVSLLVCGRAYSGFHLSVVFG